MIDYWVSEKDQGIYDAMNRGIELSSGRYLYFMGSDDTLHDSFVLGGVYNSLGCAPDVLYGNVIMGDDRNAYAGKFSKYKLLHKNICHQAIFYKREIFEVFGKYDLNYKYLADYAYNMKVFNQSGLVWLYVDMVIANYALGGASSYCVDEAFHADRGSLIKLFFGDEYLEIFTDTARLIERNRYLERRDSRSMHKRLWLAASKILKKCIPKHIN